MRHGFLAIAVALSALALISAPTACYLSRGAWEEAKILSRRQPISELVADPGTPKESREKLKVVLAARQYAKDSLKLRTKDSFTTYSRLDHDTLVLLVSAAYRDTLKPYTWWFPIVGRVPYKGYFDFGAARRAAKDLAADGFDVYVRPSDAFSTLGFFNDPLLNTTLKGDSLGLANTVIHELTHNTFYAAGQAPFNESFAMFVGARGSAAFFRSRGQDGAAARLDAQWEDDKLLARFWSRVIKSLDSAYAAHPSDKGARISARDTVYMRARAALVSEIAPQLKTINPRYAERVPLDNASLLARRVYASDLDVFDQIYEKEGRDLKRTIGRVIGLAKANPKEPFAALRKWVGVSPDSSAAQVRAHKALVAPDQLLELATRTEGSSRILSSPNRPLLRNNKKKRDSGAWSHTATRSNPNNPGNPLHPDEPSVLDACPSGCS